MMLEKVPQKHGHLRLFYRSSISGGSCKWNTDPTEYNTGIKLTNGTYKNKLLLYSLHTEHYEVVWWQDPSPRTLIISIHQEQPGQGLEKKLSVSVYLDKLYQNTQTHMEKFSFTAQTR